MKTYRWKSPSNIALVKYWGKHPIQIPANPSISFSLDACHTETSVELREEPGIEFWFEGEKRHDFLPKIQSFFKRIETLCPWVKEQGFHIQSKNTFPHSSGIASSASAMSALALCIASADADRRGKGLDKKLASEMARLGSGSACRSVYGGFTLWGKSYDFQDSSDRWALPVTDVHSDFQNLRDVVLLVDHGQKEVSSSVGHELMKGHPFAEARYHQAHKSIQSLLHILPTGDFMALADLMEREALSLHAMMMSSNPHFVLMRPGTVAIIQRIMQLRKQGLEISFTLDAGANVHLIHPAHNEQEIMDIIQTEFLEHCQNQAYICDRVGQGPQVLD